MSHPLVFCRCSGAGSSECPVGGVRHLHAGFGRRQFPDKWYDRTWAYAVFGIIGLAPLVLFFALGGRGEMATRIFAIQLGANTPTIQIGDHIVTDMNPYDQEDPKRGDLVRYKVKPGAEEFYFLRVMGLPGETVSFDKGRS